MKAPSKSRGAWTAGCSRLCAIIAAGMIVMVPAGAADTQETPPKTDRKAAAEGGKAGSDCVALEKGTAEPSGQSHGT